MKHDLTVLAELLKHAKLTTHLSILTRNEGITRRDQEGAVFPGNCTIEGLAVKKANRSLSGYVYEPLSEREHEILTCISAGLSNREIGQQLHLALQTIKWYTSQIYDKLGVDNRQQAVKQAKALNLLDMQDNPQAMPTKHNLPSPVTAFVGRETELDKIVHLLRDPTHRLVTVLAPGGMGKTRLALEAGRRLLVHFMDGISFIPLASLDSPANILVTIADALNYRFSGSDDLQQQLSGYLHDKSLLLILDNFEHLLLGAPLVTEILQAAPHVKALVTSRERLHLDGETVYTLGGMQFQDTEIKDNVHQDDAIKLFMQSARRVRPDLTWEPRNMAAMVRICRQTQGMPLAIELAAGWLDILSPEQISSEIERGIGILETELQDVPERHRSVRAAISYSWKQLGEVEQPIIMRLSVFRGGFTIEAAQMLADADRPVLRRLVSKALIQSNLEKGRYDLHELLRQYGAERLSETQQIAAIRDKHGLYFADFMAQREADLKGHRQLAALNEIAADYENIRSAWDWAVQGRNYDVLNQLYPSLFLFHYMRARFQEITTLQRQTLAQLAPATMDDWRPLRLLVITGDFSLTPDETFRQQIRDVITNADPNRERYLIAIAYKSLGHNYEAGSEFGNAIAHYEMSLAQFQVLADEFHMSWLLQRLGVCYISIGQIDQGLQFNRQSLALSIKIGNQIHAAQAVHNLGWECLYMLGNLEEAEKHFSEAIARHQVLGNRTGIASAYTEIGYIAWLHGDLETAGTVTETALAIANDVRRTENQAAALALVALIAALREDYVTCQQFAEQSRNCTSMRYPYALVWTHVASHMAACGLGAFEETSQLNDAILKQATAKQSATLMTLGVPLVAITTAHRGNAIRAVELLGLTFSQPKSTTGWLEAWPLMIRLKSKLEADLGAVTFQLAWINGTRLDLKQTVTNLSTESM